MIGTLYHDEKMHFFAIKTGAVMSKHITVKNLH